MTDRRSYDATRRRERAEEQKRQTRERVVDAARRLFLEQGYVATTIQAVECSATRPLNPCGTTRPDCGR